MGCAGALAALGLAACGAAAMSTQRSAGTATAASVAAAAPATSTPSAASTPTACAATVASTLAQVGERVYRTAATSDDVAQAVGRVQGSSALASAIASGDASAAGAALRALLRGQIVRIEVLRGGRVLASAGSGPAIAPVRGSIPGTGASFVLSVQSDADYLQVAHQITGAQVLMMTSGGGAPATRRLAGTIAGPPPATVPSTGPLSYAGQSYEVASLNGAVYPSGALRIALLVPSSALSCPGSASQTRVETQGRVGERIYEEERRSPSVSTTLHQIESSTAFRAAVAAQDPSATIAAIDGFFAAHIHVVRVRVTIGKRLLVDHGGPYVLAPVRGTLRSGGRVIGHFEFSVQDDAGYLKLAHLFTGAEVLMRVGSQQIMGTLNPGPASVPDRGTVSYGGRSYEAYSFTAEAFPSGPLRISLLIPA
jgi:hypothetical protein